MVTQDESTSESPIQKVKTLKEIYEAYTFTALELENYEKASQEEVWRKDMEEEIKMIEKKRNLGTR